MTRATTTVLIAGDGIVGMATALACAARGLEARVIGRRLPGAASSAAAGLLAPSLGHATGEVRAVMSAARDLWPAYAAELSGASGMTLTVNALGILELATDAAELERVLGEAPAWAQPLDAGELSRLEPALTGAAGALLHPGDGAVDNVAALRALDTACARRAIARVETMVRSVERSDHHMAVTTDDGQRLRGDLVVIAAGAWAPSIAGLPHEIAVAPWRGQMLALDRAVTAHCVSGAGGYLVPRGGRTLVGSTMESVGLAVATTDAAIDALRGVARALAPSLGSADEVDRWAGIRPMSPDGLPILGPDPREPRIVYGCGLSKNGILLAPLVAEAIAAWCAGSSPAHDARPFAADRFVAKKS